MYQKIYQQIEHIQSNSNWMPGGNPNNVFGDTGTKVSETLNGSSTSAGFHSTPQANRTKTMFYDETPALIQKVVAV